MSWWCVFTGCQCQGPSLTGSHNLPLQEGCSWLVYVTGRMLQCSSFIFLMRVDIVFTRTEIKLGQAKSCGGSLLRTLWSTCCSRQWCFYSSPSHCPWVCGIAPSVFDYVTRQTCSALRYMAVADGLPELYSTHPLLHLYTEVHKFSLNSVCYRDGKSWAHRGGTILYVRRLSIMQLWGSTLWRLWVEDLGCRLWSGTDCFESLSSG